MQIKTLFSDQIALPEILNTNHIKSLDGIRAISIIIVLIGHLNVGLKNPALTAVFGYGSLGVQFFFVLSGFLITTLLLKEKISTNNVDLKSFYIRRALRILPVATLFILVAFLLNFIYNLGMTKGSLIYALTYTQNFNPNESYYTSHFWSLSIEEQFYLLFPFLLNKSIRLYLIIALLVIASCPTIIYLKFHTNSHNIIFNKGVDLLYNLIPRGLISILIGSVFTILLFKMKSTTLNLQGTILGGIQILLLFSVWLIFNYNIAPGGLGILLVPVLVSVFIFTVIQKNNSFLYKLLNTKALVNIGILSYSIYIWQQLFTNHHPWDGQHPILENPILNWIAMFIVAYLSYNFFEKPFLKLKKRFENRVQSEAIILSKN